ncbi:MAG: methyltransferase domain-containing protein [Maribacter sp.]
MLKDLSVRSESPEIMDDFHGDINELKPILGDINRVNSILGGNAITLDAVFQLIHEHPRESYTILDMGCAEGSMLRELALAGRKKLIKLKLIGVDLNEDALELGKRASQDFPEIQFLAKNILHSDFSDFKCDIIITTLTLHHFPDDSILVFIKQFSKLASIGIVVNDLQRSTTAYYLFKVFSLIFIKTKVAKTDGLISIRRGFLKSDFDRYARTLPNIKHHIQWKWAFRYVWVMRLATNKLP